MGSPRRRPLPLNSTEVLDLSDAELVGIVTDPASRIDWDALCTLPLTDAWIPHTSSSKQHSPHSTEVSTRRLKDDAGGGKRSTAVLARSALRCSASELQRVLDDAKSSEQLQEKLSVVCGPELVAARIVHRVDVSSDELVTQHSHHHRLTALSVNTVTFKRTHMFTKQQREQWRYVDATADVSTGERKAFTKTLVPLRFVGESGGDGHPQRHQQPVAHSPKALIGFLIEEDEQLQEQTTTMTRVWCYAEYLCDKHPKSKLKWLQQLKVDRLVKSRLAGVAEWTDRLAIIVRRRRLGFQVLIDEDHIPSPSSHCSGGCQRSFSVNKRKVCDLCGSSVCEKCSTREMRETQRARTASDSSNESAAATTTLECIRVCTKCMVRVDQCCYSDISLDDLEPIRVVADTFPTPSTAGSAKSTNNTRTMGVVLTDLLQSTLEDAPPTRRASIVSVIKYLVNQTPPQDVVRPALVLLEADKRDENEEQQLLDQVASSIQDEPLPLDQCVLATTERRNYPLLHPEDPADGLLHPVPPSEERRLQIMSDKQLIGEQESIPELDIICSLACQELQCRGATVSVVEKCTVRVIATNLEFMKNRVLPRNEGLCSRTIMNATPLLAPHPEADIRFGYMQSIKHLNVSFYCGFPLFAEDFTVIGSLCCLGDKSQKLTQSQFTVMKKLAETASRVLQGRPYSSERADRQVGSAVKPGGQDSVG
ncbi:hypothetical protein Gpo141_00005520 [Globisporangium polare]